MPKERYDTHAWNARMPTWLWEEARRLAREKDISLNRFVVEAVQEQVEASRREQPGDGRAGRNRERQRQFH